MNIKIDDWSGLIGLDEWERIARLQGLYEDLAQMEPAEQESILENVLALEYRLTDPELAVVAGARLKAWLAMDFDEARAVIAAYDKAMDRMPGAAAMRRVQAVQNATRGMDEAEIARLGELIPSVMRKLPGSSHLELAHTDAKPQRRFSWRPPWMKM